MRHRTSVLKRSWFTIAVLCLTACRTTRENWDEDVVEPSDAMPSTDTLYTPPFVFQTTSDAEVHLKLHSSEGPIRGAVVSVRSRDPQVGLLFQGATDSNGSLSARLNAPSRIDRADVVIVAPGWSGAYTDETLRTNHGAFAPAAWITVPVQQLASLDVALERSPR